MASESPLLCPGTALDNLSLTSPVPASDLSNIGYCWVCLLGFIGILPRSGSFIDADKLRACCISGLCSLKEFTAAVAYV